MMALHGTHKLWHARDDIGMNVTGRKVSKTRRKKEGRFDREEDEEIKEGRRRRGGEERVFRRRRRRRR